MSLNDINSLSHTKWSCKDYMVFALVTSLAQRADRITRSTRGEEHGAMPTIPKLFGVFAHIRIAVKKSSLQNSWKKTTKFGAKKGFQTSLFAERPLFKRGRVKSSKEQKMPTAGGDSRMLSRTVAPAARCFVRAGAAFGSAADSSRPSGAFLAFFFCTSKRRMCPARHERLQ